MIGFTQVKSFLQGRQIRVPDDWLEACLEWLQEENEGAALTSDQLTGMVYQQFLSADLRELQMGCLPPQLANETKYMLQGPFCLQVDSLLDVSQPYYGQLQKVQGTENANVHVSATQPTQPVPEMKAGRMLMLKMTDGVSDVQGMEYQPIPALNKNLLPGCKVRIKGRLLCRKGVLFLKSENVEVLGGEVDSLVESNTHKRLLQNALASVGQSSTQDHHKEFSNTQISRQENSCAGSAAGNQGQTTGGPPRENQIGIQNNSCTGRPTSNQTHNRTSDNAAEDEMDDDDNFLASLETSEFAALDENWDGDMEDVKSGQRHIRKIKLSSTSGQIFRQADSNAGSAAGNQGQTTGGLPRENQIGIQNNPCTERLPSNRTNNRTSDNTAGDEMDDDDHLLASLETSELAAWDKNWDGDMEDVNRGQRQISENKLSSTSSSANRLQKDLRQHPTPPATGQAKPMACVNGIRQPITAQNRSQSLQETSLTRPSQLGQPRNTTNQNWSSNHMTAVSLGQRSDSNSMESEIQMELENLADLMDDDFPMEDDGDDFDDSSVFHPTLPKKSKPSKSTVEKSECKTFQSPPYSKKSLSTQQSADQQSSSVGHNDTHVICKSEDASIRTNTVLPGAAIVSSGGSGASSRQDGESTKPDPGIPSLCFQDISRLSKPSDVIDHIKSVMGSTQLTSIGSLDDDPFTYLSRVESKLQSERPFCFKVKAYVASLLGRLESRQGQGWALTCRLNDGTATLDVDITDQVLTKMIGFSVQESLALKNEKAGGQSDLSERINNCQLKLINMSSIFKVEYCPTVGRAQVTEILPVTEKHIEQLYARVCNQMSESAIDLKILDHILSCKGCLLCSKLPQRVVRWRNDK